MNFIEGTYRDLIIKYLSGECTPDETQHMLAWIQSSDENFRFFIDVKDIWEVADEDLEQDEQVLNQAWNVLEAKIDSKKDEQKGKVVKMSTSMKLFLRVAAVFVFGFFAYKYFVPEIPSQVLMADTSMGKKDIQLPDGTSVQLNYQTNFNYPENFAENNRKVNLSGEAFFDVTPNAEKPFIVDAGQVQVQVLGTSFNINSRPELDVISIVVESGVVKVYQTGNESNNIILQKGDIAEFSKKSHVFSKEISTDVNELSWKSGDLVFANSSLEDVFKAMERHYNVSFETKDKDVLTLPLTTKFSDNTLDESLSVLETIFEQVEFERKDSLIYVKSKE